MKAFGKNFGKGYNMYGVIFQCLLIFNNNYVQKFN